MNEQINKFAKFDKEQVVYITSKPLPSKYLITAKRKTGASEWRSLADISDGTNLNLKS